MGEVFLAEDTRLKRQVALKFLPAHLMANEEIKSRFLREAQATAALDDPHVCTVFEAGEHDGQAFIAMALVEGGTLKTRIAKEQLPLAEVLTLACEIAGGLAAAQLVAGEDAPKVDRPPVATPVAPAEKQVDIREGLVLEMDFDKAEPANKVTDKSGQNNHGTVDGARWTAAGHRGGAYEFTADGDRVEIPEKDSLNPPMLTLSAWIKTTCTDGAWRRIFDKGWDSGYALGLAGIFEKYNWSGQVALEMGPGSHFSVTATKIADGKWHHIVGTFDGGEQILYVDGKQDGKPVRWKEPGDVGATPFNLAIGCNRSNPPGGGFNESFRGLIDEPMVWNRALSADEVATLYKSQQP